LLKHRQVVVALGNKHRDHIPSLEGLLWGMSGGGLDRNGPSTEKGHSSVSLDTFLQNMLLLSPLVLLLVAFIYLNGQPSCREVSTIKTHTHLEGQTACLNDVHDKENVYLTG
jgi:hypothetical protein